MIANQLAAQQATQPDFLRRFHLGRAEPLILCEKEKLKETSLSLSLSSLGWNRVVIGPNLPYSQHYLLSDKVRLGLGRIPKKSKTSWQITGRRTAQLHPAARFRCDRCPTGLATSANSAANGAVVPCKSQPAEAIPPSVRNSATDAPERPRRRRQQVSVACTCDSSQLREALRRNLCAARGAASESSSQRLLSARSFSYRALRGNNRDAHPLRAFYGQKKSLVCG
jgi:hypothetical protein